MRLVLLTLIDLTEERFQAFLKSFHSTIMNQIAKHATLDEIRGVIQKEVRNYDSNLVVELQSSTDDIGASTVRMFKVFPAHGNYPVEQISLLDDELNHLFWLAERILTAEAEVARQREALKIRMENELKMARTVQETLYPSEFARYKNVEIAGFFEPASECGGDWWYHSEIDGKILFCIGDATGHGAPAALITSAARSAMSIVENLASEPEKIVELMNKAIFDVSKGNVSMTLFLGSFDPTTGRLIYCNASHEPPYLVRSSSTKPEKQDLVPLWDVNNLRLGQNQGTVYSKAEIDLQHGDFLFFYTDGIMDIMNKSGVQFGERRFLKTLVSSLANRENPEYLIKTFRKNLDDYREQNLADDVTYFCMRI